MSPRRPPLVPRRAIAIRLPVDLLEALEETADELVVSRNLLVEKAVAAFLEHLELPLREADDVPA